MPMVSAFTKKSWGDLSRRKGRAVLTMLVVALGVAGMGLFAVYPILDNAILDQLEDDNVCNVQLLTNDISLNDTQLDGLSSIDNVEAMEARAVLFLKIYIGERRENALFVGLDDFRDQDVNRISVLDGDVPGDMEVLVADFSLDLGVYGGEKGDTLKVIDVHGTERSLKVSGTGGGISYGPSYDPVFYTTIGTVRALGNMSGYNVLAFELEGSSEDEMEVTVRDIQAYLEGDTDFVAFMSLPSMREDGTWGGQEAFSDIMSLFYVLTLLTLLCSVILISSTMNTMIAEQKKEIAQLKAIGATKGQVLRSYLTTSLMVGAIGAVVGAFIGIFIASTFVGIIGSQFGLNLSTTPHIPTILKSVLAGIGVTVLASLPALYKAGRVVIREGLNGLGLVANFGEGRMDRALMNTGRLPRTAQMGIRNMARKKGRTASTTLQVALAVGTLLAVVALGHSITVLVEDEFDNLKFDIVVSGQSVGAKPMTMDVIDVVEGIEGVAMVEPGLDMMVKYGDRPVYCMAYVKDDVMYDHGATLFKGRWFRAEDHDANATVIVVGKALASKEGIGVGDNMRLMTATGPHDFEVIGIDSGQNNNGIIVHTPLSTMQDILDMDGIISTLLIRTDGKSHIMIDRTSTMIEDRMNEMGYVVDVELVYVMRAMNIESNQGLVNVIIGIGTLVVLITMIGLMSTLTMNVLERTKEIGMLRCIGAGAGQIKAIFRTEGMMMALMGWAVGVPLGYLVGRYLNWTLYKLMTLEMTLIYPVNFVLLSLLLTMLLTLIVIWAPIRRAVRFRPGEALRYQ
jgi:putative ABC transport system permease protein